MGVDNRPGQRVQVREIDFSSGCILVDAMPLFKGVGLRGALTRDLKTDKVKYKMALVPDPHVTYVTRGGFLRWKVKEDAASENPASGVGPAGLPVPGALK